MDDILSIESIEKLLLENDMDDNKVLDILRKEVYLQQIDISNGDLQGVLEVVFERLKNKIKNAN